MKLPTHTAIRARKLAHVVRRGQFVRLLRGVPIAALEHTHLRAIDIGSVIDVGANRGQFALLIRDLLGEDVHIEAFEPLDAAADAFESHAGGPNIRLHRAAAGAAPTTAVLHISNADDSSSLLPIGSRQVSIFPDSAEVGTQLVEVTTLDVALVDAELAPPTLLKVDVQGTELDVLRGARETLSRVSHVYAECSFVELYEGQCLAAEVIAELASNSFELTGVYNSHRIRAGTCVQADLLFTRRLDDGIPR